jgi:hypothetical protein
LFSHILYILIVGDNYNWSTLSCKPTEDFPTYKLSR